MSSPLLNELIHLLSIYYDSLTEYLLCARSIWKG